jgi:FkbM family methyltransferase
MNAEKLLMMTPAIPRAPFGAPLRLLLQSCRRRAKARLGMDIDPVIEHRCVTERFGSYYAGWTVHPNLLGRDSVIYSFGIGEDISFDLELISRFNLTVFAFDPTPRSIQWVEAQTLPSNFNLLRYGLASKDGTIRLHSPSNANFVSHSVIPPHRGETRAIEVPVHRLSTILQKLEHRRIDLIKMDIEGSEYDVIPDLLSAPTLPTQLLIEFHHRFRGVGLARTRQALSTLHDAGYRIFSLSPSGEEVSLIRSTEQTA